MLVDTLGFALERGARERFRFTVGEGDASQVVDVLCQPEAPRGLVAAGTVHHVAWRAPDDPSQQAWRDEIVGQGHDVTPIIDRNYFHSIYLRDLAASC